MHQNKLKKFKISEILHIALFCDKQMKVPNNCNYKHIYRHILCVLKNNIQRNITFSIMQRLQKIKLPHFGITI